MDQIKLHFSAIDWKISLWDYFILAFVLSFCIRMLLTLLRSYRYVQEIGGSESTIKRYGQYFWRLMLGKPIKDIANLSEEEKGRYRGDYLVPFILGFIELSAFPILLAAGSQIYIGAWISLKMLAQYKHWSEDPNKFNAFLLGNALVLVLSFAVYVQWYAPLKT